MKLLQKGVRVHHRRVILMQKMQNFSGEGDTPSPHPTARHLDLNPSHSEILPTLLVVKLNFFKNGHRFAITNY